MITKSKKPTVWPTTIDFLQIYTCPALPCIATIVVCPLSLSLPPSLPLPLIYSDNLIAPFFFLLWAPLLSSISTMAGLMVVTLLLSMAAYSSAMWCVCKGGVSDTMLQKTLDYACGAGAECTATHSNGPCYNPNTVRSHCNYAVNSYFQKKGQAQGSCDFSGTAIVSTTDPSYSGCLYPASAGTVTTAPVTTTTPSSNTTAPGVSTTTPVGNSPFLTTPTGVLGPPGTGINTDVSDGGVVFLGRINVFAFLIAIMASGFMF